MAADRVVVVGAGIAGLLAARRIVDAGYRVLVLDEGRQVGGRLATRRLAGATLDHGAQFFTARSSDFKDVVHGWLAGGRAYLWCLGFDHPPDGHPRYAATGGMAALAAALAGGLDVRLGSAVTAVDQSAGHVTVAGGRTVTAAAVILTPPVPRSLALLDVAVGHALGEVRYEPTLAVLAVLDGPSAVPPPGGVQLTEGAFSHVADNQMKGVSGRPAVTLHATGELSTAWWRDPDPELLRRLLDEGRRWLAREPVAAELHRWPYARPSVLHPDRCVALAGAMPVVLAGDAFSEARVEGAARSGWAAAEAVLERLA